MHYKAWPQRKYSHGIPSEHLIMEIRITLFFSTDKEHIMVNYRVRFCDSRAYTEDIKQPSWTVHCAMKHIGFHDEDLYEEAAPTIIIWPLLCLFMNPMAGPQMHRTLFHYKDFKPGMGIPMLKIRLPWDHLSYFWHGNSYTAKMTSLYQNWALAFQAQLDGLRLVQM